MKKFYLLIVAALAFGITSSGCGKEDSPEDALEDLQMAIANQDRQLLESRVDSEKFLDVTYTDITEQIAANISELHTRYPDDPYFWNTPQFIKTYNESHRTFYLNFVNASVNAYFNPNTQPDSFINIFAIQCAKEFKNICAAMETNIREVKVDGNHATIDFELKGDNSPYGQFIGSMIFKFAFEKNSEDRWRLIKIANLNDLIYPLVDRAEIVWPDF